MMGTIASILGVLAEHGDLIEDILEALRHGTPKAAIKAAIRGAKVAASDAAFREELGL